MKLRLLALAAFVLCLSSCFDITETFNIKEDGSGTYELKMDMSRAIAMMAMMKQGGAKDDMRQPEKMDSTIFYRTFTDTASGLTAEERAIFHNGYAKIHMDEEEGEMYTTMYFSFANGKELSVIQKALTKSGDGSIIDAVGNVLKGGKDMPGGGMDQMMGGMGAGQNADKQSGLPISDFIYLLNGNNFSRKVKPSENTGQAEPKEDEVPAQVKAMMKMNYTTIVNLPKPAKKLSGQGTLSEDKKQLKFTKSMSMLDKHNPVDYNFSIDY